MPGNLRKYGCQSIICVRYDSVIIEIYFIIDVSVGRELVSGNRTKHQIKVSSGGLPDGAGVGDKIAVGIDDGVAAALSGSSLRTAVGKFFPAVAEERRRHSVVVLSAAVCCRGAKVSIGRFRRG